MKSKLNYRILTGLLLFSILLIASVSVSAQESGKAVSLNIQQAVEFALKNHVDVKNAELEVGIAKARMNELVGAGLPQVNGSADINKFIEIPTQFIPGEFFDEKPGTFIPVKFGQNYSASAGISASQLLFDGTYLVGLKASKVYSELSKKDLQRTKIDVAVNVTKAYYLVLVANERLKQLASDLERLGKVKSDTKALYDNGFVEKIDYDRIELNFNLLESAKNQAERLTANSYKLLNFQMGMDINTTVELTENINDLNLLTPVLENETVDLNNRIEYSALQTQYELTGLDVRRYKSYRLPSLVLFGNLSANASRDEFTIFETDYKWYPTSIVGASLKLPLFGGLKINQQVRQAKLTRMKVENTINSVEQGIQLEFKSAITNLNNNIDRLSTQAKNRDLAREIARVSKIKYDQGVGSNLEVIDAESSLREAETNYYTALLETIMTKIELDKAKRTFKY